MQRFGRTQAGDFVLDLQLASFHFGDLKSIRPGVGHCLFDLLFQRLVAPLELCKMRFHGHSRLLFSGLTIKVCHRFSFVSNTTTFALGISPEKLCTGDRRSAGRRFAGCGRTWYRISCNKWRAVRMGGDESVIKPENMVVRAELAQLRQEHRDLDMAIEAVQSQPHPDTLQVQRLKKKKLVLKDRIAALEDSLTPDIIA